MLLKSLSVVSRACNVSTILILEIVLTRNFLKEKVAYFLLFFSHLDTSKSLYKVMTFQQLLHLSMMEGML